MCWMAQEYPPKYIWEPWKAPLSVQEAAGCIIGKDYPAPIVDHAEASRRYPKAQRHSNHVLFTHGSVAFFYHLR